MRVLAATFPDREQALQALGTLRRRLGLADDDAAIAPLGQPGRKDDGSDTLLAGRFEEQSLELVRTTITSSGGRVVADVDEQWTRPRTQPTAPADPASRTTSARRRGARRQNQPVAH